MHAWQPAVHDVTTETIPQYCFFYNLINFDSSSHSTVNMMLYSDLFRFAIFSE